MKICLGLVLILMMSIGGRCLADSATLQSSMQPIGNGEIRYMGFIKVYDASLSASRMVTGGEVLDTEISKCLILNYAVPLTVDKFIRGAEMVLQRQHSKEALRAVRQQIDSLHAQYRDVQEGDSYTLCYDAVSSTTTLSLNQEELASIVSADFAKFYFGIWLGSDAPLDEGLRDNLLAANR
jgi:hypothetical protein